MLCTVCDSPDHTACGCETTKGESCGKNNWMVRAADKPTESCVRVAFQR